MINTQDLNGLNDYFAAQQDVLAVYLYGSYARATNNPLSDFDIAIMPSLQIKDITRRHLDFIGAISSILKTDMVDIQLLTLQTPPALALSMLKGKLIYCKSFQQKASLEGQLLSRYQDFLPFQQLQIRSMEQRLKEGTYAGRH